MRHNLEAKKKLLKIDPATGAVLASLANQAMAADKELKDRLQKPLSK